MAKVLRILSRSQYEGDPDLDFETWDIDTMQAPGSVRVTDTSMTLPLAFIFSEAFGGAPISTRKEREAESGNDYFKYRSHDSVDSKTRLRAIPVEEFIDGVTGSALRFRAGEVVQNCRFCDSQDRAIAEPSCVISDDALWQSSS